MDFLANRDVLVIVGGWNANILLNPQWLKRYLFTTEDKFNLNVDEKPGLQFMPSIVAGKFRLALQGNRLSLSVQEPNPALLTPLQDLASKVADFLPHTPAVAYGINFVFNSSTTEGRSFLNAETPVYKLLCSRDGTVSEEQSQYSMVFLGGKLNIFVKETPQADGRMLLEIAFNFHREVKDLAAMKAGLAECSICTCLAKAQETAEAIVAALQ